MVCGTIRMLRMGSPSRPRPEVTTPSEGVAGVESGAAAGDAPPVGCVSPVCHVSGGPSDGAHSARLRAGVASDAAARTSTTPIRRLEGLRSAAARSAETLTGQLSFARKRKTLHETLERLLGLGGLAELL